MTLKCLNLKDKMIPTQIMTLEGPEIVVFPVPLAVVVQMALNLKGEGVST